MKDEELKPCPFCGNEDVHSGYDNQDVFIYCNECSACCADGDGLNLMQIWNTRPKP